MGAVPIHQKGVGLSNVTEAQTVGPGIREPRLLGPLGARWEVFLGDPSGRLSTSALADSASQLHFLLAPKRG